LYQEYKAPGTPGNRQAEYDKVKAKEFQRNVFYGVAGAFTVGFGLTFVF
jgi:hypothetical protein